MTISSVKTGAVGLSLALDNNYMEPIATTLVGSGGTNNITFNDIPQTYKHLQIRCIWLHSVVDVAAIIRFNSDNSANYTQHILRGNGSTVSASANTTSDGITGTSVTIQASTNAGSVGASIIDILDYTNTNKNKTVRTLAGQDVNGAGNIRLYSGLWINTNAISSISIVPNSGSLNQYSRFSLYGIKG